MLKYEPRLLSLTRRTKAEARTTSELHSLSTALSGARRGIMMKQLARAAFEIKSWDEKQYGEMAGAAKMTRVSVTKAYQGDLEGEGTLEYLMAYGHDGSASFVGIERVIGRVGEKSGNFVFQHVGTFKGGVAESTWSVVPNSGTGDLQGLRGEVSSALGHATSYPVEFRYELG